jgi:hypothetical protein
MAWSHRSGAIDYVQLIAGGISVVLFFAAVTRRSDIEN